MVSPDTKPFLSIEEIIAALLFSRNSFVSKPERRAALDDVMRNLAAFPEREVHDDGTVTILFELGGDVHVQTISPSLVEQ